MKDLLASIRCNKFANEQLAQVQFAFKQDLESELETKLTTCKRCKSSMVAEKTDLFLERITLNIGFPLGHQLCPTR